MATIFDYAGDGATVRYSFPSPYINQTHIHAYVGEPLVETFDFTFDANTSEVVFSIAPTAPLSNPSNIRIRRITPNDPLVVFTKPGALKAADLNKAILQLLYRDEEISDTAGAGLGTDPVPNWILGWNDTGDAIVSIDPADIATFEFAAQNLLLDSYADGVDYTSGTTTNLPLGANPGSKNNTQVTFDGVVQHKGSYDLSGTLITFDSVIPLGTENVEIVRMSVQDIGVPSDGSVDTAQLASGAVDATKLAIGLASLTMAGPISGFTTIAPGTVPDITGSRGGNAALASLLTALATLGLITDSTS